MDLLIQMYYSTGLDARCDNYFIRDSDFDEFLGNLPQGDAVRIIDRYSVENYVFTVDAVKRLILERFGVDPQEFDVDQCISRYENCVQEIFSHLSPIIGGAIAAVSSGITVDLNALDVRKFAKEYFVTGVLPPIEDGHYAKVKISAEFRNADSTNIGLEFVTRDAILWMRGHYLSEICSVFIQRTHESLKDEKKSGGISTMNSNINGDFSPPSPFERRAPLCGEPAVLNNL